MVNGAFYFLFVLGVLVLGACGGGSGDSGSPAAAPPAPSAPEPAPAVPGAAAAADDVSAMAALGKRLFGDRALSASGQQSCRTCHQPSRAYTAAPADPAAGPWSAAPPVPLGGPEMDRPGFRNAPALAYASFTPAFFFHRDGTPTGGFFRDGRAASLAEQAMRPFLSPFEMGNASAAEVLARMRAEPCPADDGCLTDQFEALFGAEVLRDPQAMLAAVGAAIAAFERESSDFHPFSSKFDHFQRGEVVLTARELRGFALFNSPTRGNCAACHVSTSADGVVPPLFTDFTYDNIGLPRNRALAVNDDATTLDYVPMDGDDGFHTFYDLGLCGPFRALDGNVAPLCGQFKVPTLRNVAITPPYFHNGVFDTLAAAVGFYVRRDTHPEAWFPAGADGSTVKFDDLPTVYGGQFAVSAGQPGSDAGYHGNVNHEEAPYDRVIGEPPRLTADEIDDVVAFLCTLTDGYDPAHPDDYPWPPQCEAVEPRGHP